MLSLLKINIKYIKQLVKTNNNGEQVVSAKELYLFLGMDKSNWVKWAKNNIIENPFAFESQDWEGFVLMTSGNETTDYGITLDFAKRIAMMAKTEKREEARKYFIECEKLIKENIIKPRTHLEVLDSEREVWHPVIGYECNYEASSIGRIRSIDRVVITNKKKHCKSIILKPRLGNQGYFYVSLYLNGKAKTFNVHQIIAISFLNHSPCGYKIVVNHKNFDKKDNRVDNLELITNRANSLKLNIKSSSIYTGVSFCKARKLWKSQVYINGKTINIGYFNCETKAHLNYLLTLKSVSR